MKKLLITLNIFSIYQLNNSKLLHNNNKESDEIDNYFNDFKEEETYDLVEEPPQLRNCINYYL